MFNDFYNFSLKRQSCRNFLDKPVEREKLLRCVEAAGQSPSACNSQPWKFIVVQDDHKRAQVAKCTQQMKINGFTDNAGAFFVVLEEHAKLMRGIRSLIDDQYFAKGDLGAATYGLCLEAESQGLGTCILGMFDRTALREILDLADDQRIFMVVAVGYPAEDTVREKVRKSIDDIAVFI